MAAPEPSATVEPELPAEHIPVELTKEEEDLPGLKALISPMEGKLFGSSMNHDTMIIMIKHKLLKELIIAVKFDEILNKGIKFKLIKGKRINDIKIDLMNYLSDMDKPEYTIDEKDDEGTIIEKMDKLVGNIKKYAINSDVVNRSENHLNFKHK